MLKPDAKSDSPWVMRTELETENYAFAKHVMGTLGRVVKTPGDLVWVQVAGNMSTS